ncbi:MAG: transposase [Thermoproteus sp. AZ2]|jgi:hypothetical protein|uniref:Transposase n=1 Tax=Thermoproteus sp. AZ2 TaxID=1609232 RepID=A0ACC6V147_9CREN|nr:MAG: transposase [Thermoproteus sp. AZ2]
MDVVLVLHGSKSPDYLASASSFSKRTGLRYVFVEDLKAQSGEAVYVPVFVAGGADYRRASEMSGSSIPPLARWPGFADYLRGLRADVYVFHGGDPEAEADVEALGLPYVYLEGKPHITSRGCVGRAAPVVLARGVIYNRIAEAYRGCPTELLPPLFEQEGFADYFLGALRGLIKA